MALSAQEVRDSASKLAKIESRWGRSIQSTVIPVSNRMLIRASIDLADPQCASVQADLEAIKKIIICDQDVYEYAEIAQSQLVAITSSREVAVQFVEDCNRLDLTHACPNCWSGFRQAESILIRRESLPRDSELVVMVPQRTLLVRDAACLQLQEQLGAVCKLLPVHDHIQDESVGWSQLIPETTMPPMDIDGANIVSQKSCGICGRDGHFNHGERSFRPSYSVSSSSVVDNRTAIYQTYEHFGWAGRRRGGSSPATPWLLLAPELWVALKQLDPEGVSGIPVRFDPACSEMSSHADKLS